MHFITNKMHIVSGLKYINLYGCLDPHNIFPLFLNKMAVIIAPKLAKNFRGLIATGSFPSLWRTGNITPIPKATSPSQFPLDYRPISIPPSATELNRCPLTYEPDFICFLLPGYLYLPRKLSWGRREGKHPCQSLFWLCPELLTCAPLTLWLTCAAFYLCAVTNEGLYGYIAFFLIRIDCLG